MHTTLRSSEEWQDNNAVNKNKTDVEVAVRGAFW